jgi:rare lipoprotein A
MFARGAALAPLVATLAACSLVRAPEPDLPMRGGIYHEFHAPPLDEPLNQPVAAPPSPEARALLGNPPFYDVDGHRYFVRDGTSGHMERGVASWYGRKFHGRRTANGERFDMHEMTAAHRTLPLPSRVRVTNLETGRSVVVRVNDRGPFKDDRILDVSYAAAHELGMVKTGTAFVEVQTMETPAPGAGAGIQPFRLYAQVGAFGETANAARMAEQVRTLGFDGVDVHQTDRDGVTLQRVLVGPVDTVPEFDDLVLRLQSAGFSDARLALD